MIFAPSWTRQVIAVSVIEGDVSPGVVVPQHAAGGR